MLYLRHTEQNNDKNFQIFNILVKYKKKSITFVAKTEFMRARIMFDWAGNIYDWDIDWPLPFFPNKGETFDFKSFVDAGIIKDFKDVVFVGLERHEGLEKSIMDMLQNEYNTVIENINWRATSIEIELTTTLYRRRDSMGYNLWKEKKEQ